jgi:ParB family chromosome partitioning protein
MSDIQNISLRHLELSPLNVRQVRTKEAITAMAASILAQGLLQNLHVHTQAKGGYAVVIGGTRLEAMKLLLKEKKITEDFQVACEVHAENDPKLAELSLSENVVRSSMHPADEFDGFANLAVEGQGPEEIGARFGKTAKYVQQRMKLASLSPKLLKALRADEINMDQAMAFTLTDSHKTQDRVWKELPAWARQRGDSEAIRNALTNQHIEADSKLATFIGLDTYEQSGGAILRDLFAEEGTGWLINTDLVNRIVEEKLSEAAEAVKAEGWKWVRHAPGFSYEDTQKDGRLYPTNAEPTAEAQAELEKLQAEADSIMESHGEEPEEPEIYAKLEQLGARMEELREGPQVWTAEQKAASGVYVSIGHNGELHIQRGVVKPEDKAAARKLGGSAANGTADKPAKPKGGLPASLMAELTSFKTVAAQVVAMDDPKSALLAVTHALAIQQLYKYPGNHSSLLITAKKPSFGLATNELIDKSPVGKARDAKLKAIQKKLPKKPEDLWAWLLKQTPSAVNQVLSAAFATTIDLVQVNGSEATQSAGELTTALKLDMAQHWQATAENYFTRVPKKLLLEELGTAVSAATKRQLEPMKRDAMAKAITTELKNRKWLPPILRAGKPGVA